MIDRIVGEATHLGPTRRLEDLRPSMRGLFPARRPTSSARPSRSPGSPASVGVESSFVTSHLVERAGAWSEGLEPLRALRSIRSARWSPPAARGQQVVDPHAPALVEVTVAVVPVGVDARFGISSRSVSTNPHSFTRSRALRSGGVTCVLPSNAAGSHTSLSVGAMFQSPPITSGHRRWWRIEVVPQPAQPARACSGSGRGRPRGRWGRRPSRTRTPPVVHQRIRASTSGSRPSSKPYTTSSIPTFDRTATPFHWFRP